MPKKPRVWLSTAEAAAELGCGPKYLRENRDTIFKKGTHYRVLNPNAWRPTYRWHLKKIQKLMEA
ncbi:DNA-binding protein [Nodosilinea sp. FACHB-131]|uniref:DNA-binding protein n=1 Tax=Cyanophyceae TaxID=3028117 RepID=UPI001689B340|nr:DNA-binding protein [Nodosilinea sp. FACHB-131]MBD1876229.1 DNA-binding protein [Nodosilinea sp. FACHB-131]